MSSAKDFWSHIDRVLLHASKSRTADELITAVKAGPDQDHGAGDAFFAGSGGDNQLIDVLYRVHWSVKRIEGDYWWTATAKSDGSVVEYIEGDLYLRPSTAAMPYRYGLR
ncbi:MAG: hypothetical protein WAV90_19225 [Gordonia amarae]